MGRDDPAGGSNLPAPYRNPWRSLAEAMSAVAADSRLRLQELWRRNGEGDLRRPGWWPRDLAPLFWPLLLAAVLTLLAAGFSLALPRIQQLRAPAPSPSTASEPRSESPADNGPALNGTAGNGSDRNGPATGRPSEQPAASGVAPAVRASEPDAENTTVERPGERRPASEATRRPQPGSESRSALDAQPGSERVPDAVSEPVLEPEPESAPLDPLVELLERPGSDGLLRAAEGQPQRGTLQLQVRPAFKRLQRAEQQRHAELWQAWAQELGYDHLELRDGLGALLARDALVGSGMIVLSSQPA
jgi:hypothetical protein